MFRQIIVEKDVKKCPQCGEVLEWVGGRIDKINQSYICKKCRIHIEVTGFSKEDQETLALEVFE